MQNMFIVIELNKIVTKSFSTKRSLLRHCLRLIQNGRLLVYCGLLVL